MAELRQSYITLKKRLNKTPYLLDFEHFGILDPLVIINKEKTYYNFLTKMGDNEGLINERENLALKFVGVELLSGLRPHELLVLEEFIVNQRTQMTFPEIEELFVDKDVPCSKDTFESTIKVLDLSFYETNLRRTYAEIQFFRQTKDGLLITDCFEELRGNAYFKHLMLDLVKTGLSKSQQYDLHRPLNLYKKYRRKDVLRMLNMDFVQNELGIGGYTDSNNHFVIFIIIDKGVDFNSSMIAYENDFIDNSSFRWFTKSPRSMESREVRKLLEDDDLHVHLFIKRKFTKNDNETDFYYMGEIEPIKLSAKEIQIPTDSRTKKVVEIDFRLKEDVEPNIFEYLTKTD